MAPLNKAFEVHLLNAAGMARAHRIAKAFDTLLTELQEVCPAGRELAIVTTKLEEACFFAKKAMANTVENQQPEQEG